MGDVKPNPITDFFAGGFCYFNPDGEICDAFFRYHLDPKINNLKGRLQNTEDKFRKANDQFQRINDQFQRIEDEFQKAMDAFKKIEDQLDPKERLKEISEIRFRDARHFQALSFPHGRGFLKRLV